MTAMPQMVALYNGMGGGAAGAIAAVELFGDKSPGRHPAGRDAAGRADRRRVAVRLADRLGQARRRDQEAAAGAGSAGLQWRWSCWPRSRSAAISCSWRRAARIPLVAMPVDHRLLLRPRAGLRRPDDAADRRGGHAGRDLDLQRLHRPGGRPRRLRAAEPGADDRRHGGRRRRHAADAAHGEGDESLGRQRALHQFRRGRRSTSRARSRAA